ncbi:hypothetical protein NS274_02080 [Pseudomonas oryzihabitans]|nr:hypothetical protein NS274_02080 [Pseudomonas psychrotolerans]KTS99429.1 hypothetical protein NS376_16865 [Pseudomonas psychrotolerans]KTT46758.1 hypothetical protein SB11R_21055 [Pseudomonas psychrotolerans]
MIIEMRTWARMGSPGVTRRATAPLSVLQSSINSLHLANESRKLEAQQTAAAATEPDPVEPPEPDTLDEGGAADADEEGDPGEVDDQAGAGDPLNR